MNDDDCCLICGKGPFVSLNHHYAHSPECETAAELFCKPATAPDNGQEEYDGVHQSISAAQLRKLDSFLNLVPPEGTLL